LNARGRSPRDTIEAKAAGHPGAKGGSSAGDERNGLRPHTGSLPVCRHFLSLLDLSAEEARALVDRTLRMKRGEENGRKNSRLLGRTLGLIFEKPSLRTRVSFEAAMARLGGSSIFLRGKDVGLGVRESVSDFARVLSHYVDVLAVRTFAHSTVEELARHASIPVINALSDSSHPCQAMADMVTIEELRGTLAGQRLVFVGDGNNVARSLAAASALLGVDFVLCAPPGYEFPTPFVDEFAARFPGHSLKLDHDPRKAVKNADVVYTDVWASMGQEHEADLRREVFAPYQVNEAMLARARSDALFLHCLPAHRGEEVTSGVLDGPHSQVFPQAANRMHFQVALLLWLLSDPAS
jgi:ornithine carbamoyltransferase